MLMWLCVIVGTAVLVGGGYLGFKYFGIWALQREEAERERLAAQWKQRSLDRQAKMDRESGVTPEDTGPTDM